MYRGAFLTVAALLMAVSVPMRADAQTAEGSRKLIYLFGGQLKVPVAIVKLKTEGDKTTGELVASRSPKATLKSLTQAKSSFRLAMTVGTVEYVFETTAPRDAEKLWRGTLAIDGTLYVASLAPTDETTLDPKAPLQRVDCPPMEEARKLTAKVTALRLAASRSKDPDRKKELLEQAADADRSAKKEAAKLYREVVAKYADSPAVFEAALNLMRSAQSNEVKPAEAKGWATTALAKAKAYGPRWQADFTAQAAAALVAQEGFAKLALEYARQAEKALTPQTSASDQVRVLGLLTRALRKTGKDDEAKSFDVRIAKLDLILDREYLAKMPPFKGEKFTARKSNSERVVFMELFTGAMCPPCVAADVAFDVLQKTYKPTELVLVQYHMHIPGPDPLTNPDTETRWKYYGDAFPTKIRGVPSSLFNGKPQAGGGGGLANAEKKYDEYREVIASLLDEAAAVNLTVKAQRQEDKIDIHVEVSGLAEPSSNKKLRIILAEEAVRYAGSNKIRFHHNVVRAFPGGVAGKSLNKASSKHTASVVVGDLRGDLVKYLDEYEANVRPFFNPARPLAMEQLRVIAFVQDDSTQEVLQAVQVEVEGK